MRKYKKYIEKTPVLFCKYLRNESSDLHEILCGGQYLVGLYFKFHQDSCINARARVVKARAHVLLRFEAKLFMYSIHLHMMC